MISIARKIEYRINKVGTWGKSIAKINWGGRSSPGSHSVPVNPRVPGTTSWSTSMNTVYTFSLSDDMTPMLADTIVTSYDRYVNLSDDMRPMVTDALAYTVGGARSLTDAMRPKVDDGIRVAYTIAVALSDDMKPTIDERIVAAGSTAVAEYYFIGNRMIMSN